MKLVLAQISAVERASIYLGLVPEEIQVQMEHTEAGIWNVLPGLLVLT